MPRALRRSLAEHAALVTAIAITVWRLREFLPLHTLPMRGDPALRFRAGDLTAQWVPWLRAAVDALWRHGVLAFWDPFTHAGSPHFESPEAGVLSLATLLAGVVPLEAAVKWAILAHIVAGMVGVYALALRLRTRPTFAAVGALAFALGTYLLDHTYLGHLSYIYPMGLAPWALFFIWSALDAHDAWWRPAAAGGIVLGLEVLEGSASAMVYSLMACCLVVVGGIGPGWKRWLQRTVGVGAVAAACFVATAAPQLLPMTTYIAATGRGGGLTLAQSSVFVGEVLHPLPTTTAVIFMVAGIAGLWSRGQRRAAVWLGATVAVGLAAANVEAVYAFLWRYFPGMRYQRIPQRALFLMGIAGPLLIASGAETVWRVLRRWRTAGAVCACAGLAWFVYEAWTIAPGVPPMVDARIELELNHAMRWLAQHADGTRINLWDPPGRNWLIDNISVPLGLETLSGATSAEHHDYLKSDFDPPDRRTFLGDAYANPARFWGLLNVRYVLSETPRDLPEFSLAARVERCPIATCQPFKSTGPFIYENRKFMPRAWMVRRAVALVGKPQPVFDAALDLLNRPDFDPAQLVVLQLPPDAPIPAVDAVFPVDMEISGTFRWRTPGADSTLEQLIHDARGSLEPARFTRPNPNRIEVHAPSDGWLVVSEKLALWPGWSASIKRVTTNLYRADAILTAVKVRSGDTVRASYEPPRFRLGVGLFATMVAALFVAFRRTPMRRSAAAAAITAGTVQNPTSEYRVR